MIPVTGATGHAGVIGDPVAHSLSPVLHNAAYDALGIDLVYGAYVVRAGEARAALFGARALGFVGLSVTTPHKDTIAQAADQRSSLVERLGAANSVVFESGVSVAHCTDGAGLLADLARAWGFDPSGARCVVLGAGGAARAVIAELAGAGAASVVVVNRSHSRGLAAAELAGARGSLGSLADLGGADLVVNATSIGLSSDAAATAAAEELAAGVTEGQRVVDLVYRPATSPFLAAAQRRGATTRNGLGMLVHQAAAQVELFCGRPAPVEAMWAAVSGEATE